MDDDRKSGWKTFTEEIEVTGQQLLETINGLIAFLILTIVFAFALRGPLGVTF